MKVCTIVRGAPTSGKSFIAKAIAAQTGADHWEADMFYYKDGVYRFDPMLLPKAHVWCQERFCSSLKDGKSVVVSNTFVKVWEMEPYLECLKKYYPDYKLQIIHVQGEFENDHGVPLDKVAMMRDKFEPYKL